MNLDDLRAVARRHFRLVLLLAAVAVGLHVGLRLRGMSYDTPVTIPRASAGEVIDIAGWHLVHLTSDGDVIHRGRTRSLDQLAEELGGDEAPVLLCADANASALNVSYFCYLFSRRAPLKPLWIAVEDGWRRAAMRVRLGIGKLPCYAVYVGAPDTISNRPPADWDLAYYVGGERVGGDADLADELEDRWPTIRKGFEAMGYETDEYTGAVEADSIVPFQWIVNALDALDEIGVAPLWIGSVAAHPWVRGQPRLDRPRWRLSGTVWGPTRVVFGTERPAVELPAAPGVRVGGQPDLQIGLRAGGGLFLYGHPTTFDELTGRFARVARRGWRRRVRMRADKNARWQHVAWILGALREHGLTNCSFTVVSTADLSHDADEAASLGVERIPQIPPPAGFGESEVRLRLAPGGAAGTRVVLRHAAPVAIECDGVVVPDLEAFASTVASNDRFTLDVPADLALKYVVAVLARLPAGATVFAGAESPPPEVRGLRILPS